MRLSDRWRLDARCHALIAPVLLGAMNGRDEHGYDAFISYSHGGDGKLAPTLQTGIERFAKPWYRIRALKVFRDQSSLSANPKLWPSAPIHTLTDAPCPAILFELT